MELDRQAFLRRGCAVAVTTGFSGLVAASAAEAAFPSPPAYFTANPFFPQARDLVSKGSDATTAFQFAKDLDPFAVLPVAGLFAQFADDPRGLSAINDPLAPLGAANALGYVVQTQQAEVCGKSGRPATPVRLFEVSNKISLPSCRPLTATRALTAITLFFGLRAVSKVFLHDVLTAAPRLAPAAKQGPKNFVRVLRPSLEHEAVATTNSTIREALVPRLEPLVSDLVFAALTLWLTFCR